jgi:zinc transport system ATP-binding protein
MESYVVEIENLSLRYLKYTALSGLNLLIPHGSFVSIVGPNGAGKTTLLKLLLGIVSPTEGSVKVLGKKPETLSPFALGYVPQIKTLDRTFPAIPLELVSTGVTARWAGAINKKQKEEVMSALNQVGILSLAESPLNRLSGGELQRVYLARALIRKPKLLILDEPAMGIDWVAEKDIHKIIDEYKAGTGAAVIMVTHDWESAYHHADYVLMLNREKICFDKPEVAFKEECISRTFGHVGHMHKLIMTGGRHDV